MLLTVTAIKYITILDPIPLEGVGRVTIQLAPGEVKGYEIYPQQFYRLQADLDDAVAAGMITYITSGGTAGAVLEADFNANTILAANVDDTPLSLTIAEQTMLGRITAGNITALTPTEIRTLINVEDGATAGIGAGSVLESDYNANTILSANVDDTPIAVDVAEQTMIGRITAGVITALTPTEIRTLLNVADGATAGGGSESETLTYTDTSNLIAGPLSAAVASPSKSNLFVITGVPQDYTTDFTIREVIGGSAPGWYILLSPGSTAPGGGSFAAGTSPATGISSVLLSGDKLRVVYA